MLSPLGALLQVEGGIGIIIMGLCPGAGRFMSAAPPRTNGHQRGDSEFRGSSLWFAGMGTKFCVTVGMITH